MSLTQLAYALGHPLGRSVLRLYDDREQPLSPAQAAEALDLPPPDVDRHVNLLVKGGLLEPVEPAGAYRSTLDDQAEWVRGVLEASRESDGQGPDG